MSTSTLVDPNVVASEVLEELHNRELGMDRVQDVVDPILEKHGILLNDFNRKLVLKQIVKRKIKEVKRKLPRIKRFIPQRTEILSHRPMNSADAHSRWEHEREEQAPVVEEVPLPPVKTQVDRKGQFFFDLMSPQSKTA